MLCMPMDGLQEIPLEFSLPSTSPGGNNIFIYVYTYMFVISFIVLLMKIIVAS